MSKKKFQSKIRKQKARATERANSFNRVYDEFMSADHDELSSYLAPSENTVYFQGLRPEIVQHYFVEMGGERKLGMNVSAIQDLYAEVPTGDGMVKVHYMPAFGPCGASELISYFKETFRKRKREGDNIGKTLEMLDNWEDIIATCMIEWDGIIVFGYVVSTSDGKALTITVDSKDWKDCTRAEDKAYLKYQKTKAEKDYFDYLAIHERNNKFTSMRRFGLNCINTIQHIIFCYLRGIELPKFDITQSNPVLIPAPPSNPSKPKKRNPKTPDEDKPSHCVAYIYYDADVGKISITGRRQYSAKWWIVSGHQRHNANGTISDVSPYIKGDKTDPDAQKALQVFVECQKRIQCYKLVPKH